jgi:hypothetical protein
MSSLNYKYAWRSVAKKTKTIEKNWLKKLNPKKKKKLRKPIKKTSATLNTLPDRLFSLAISHSGLPSSLMEVATSPLHLRLLSLRCVPSLYIKANAWIGAWNVLPHLISSACMFTFILFLILLSLLVFMGATLWELVFVVRLWLQLSCLVFPVHVFEFRVFMFLLKWVRGTDFFNT